MADGEEPTEAEAPKEVPPLEEEDRAVRAPIYEAVFSDCPGQVVKEKSRAERKEAELDSKSLTYAEVNFELVNEILTTIKQKCGPLYEGKGVFLDLGSGVGKACVAAAMAHPFQKAVGLETLQCLSDMATAAATKYQEAQFPEGMAKPEVQLVKADFIADFDAQVKELAPEVTVCFAVATCYGEKEIQALAAAARLLPEKSVFVSFSQALPEDLVVDPDRQPLQRRAAAVKKALKKRGTEPTAAMAELVVEPPVNDPQGFELIHSEAMAMPWGDKATVFFYKKPEQPKEEEEEAAPAEEAEEQN